MLYIPRTCRKCDGPLKTTDLVGWPAWSCLPCLTIYHYGPTAKGDRPAELVITGVQAGMAGLYPSIKAHFA